MKDNTILAIVIIIALLFVAIGRGILVIPDLATLSIYASSVPSETVQILESSESSPECVLTSDADRYCIGDWATVTLDGEPSTTYSVYINKDDMGYILWGERATDYLGNAEQAGYLNDAGHYQVRAISPTCYSNVLEVDVIECGEDCWWQSIATEDTTLPSGLFTNWFGTMVDGKFKYEWYYGSNGIKTEVLKNAVVQHSSSSQSGNYEFDANNGETWQISAANYMPASSNVHFELFQWVCEGDQLNWAPDMLGSMGQISQQELDESCYSYCTSQAYIGGWYAGNPGDCTAQAGTYQANGCCCYNTLM